MYELRKVKVSESASQETVCFEAERVKDGSLVAFVSNDGRGGPNREHFSSETARSELNDYLDTIPPEVLSPLAGMLHMKVDSEEFVGRLVELWHEKDVAKKILKRWCKNEVLFKTKDCTDGQWRTIKAEATPALCAQIRAQYGADLVAIANEDIDKAAELLVGHRGIWIDPRAGTGDPRVA